MHRYDHDTARPEVPGVAQQDAPGVGQIIQDFVKHDHIIAFARLKSFGASDLEAGDRVTMHFLMGMVSEITR